MTVAVGKAAVNLQIKALGLVSKRRWKEERCDSSRSYLSVFCRHVSDHSFDRFRSGASINAEDIPVTGSSEFEKWHNGGGFVHKLACIDPTAVIEIGAAVHPKSFLGANVHIGSGAVVGPSVMIGQSTKIGYNVSLSNCSVGNSCVIHNGVCIGQDGFGFFVDEQGNILKKPQLLYVRVGNQVEVGANTCIDRGSWRDTAIGDHSKIDNLVQIGHNVVLGKCCMLCGQVGIAGSVTIGDYVTLGGKVAIRDHVSIASKVRLAANSCVTKDIAESGDYGSNPRMAEASCYSTENF
ncbi:putative UDP-3-O-acylglucosamine N-acyltransferase 2, mitochondrial isoform X2 [Tasmannia lanceolata]|uniref:putative UDP-3-O-acylglucosamine N-acyltransferase 2, mitochondrial isoform X2 n=1 Tax=Tasmannia lanceolata TaxID=3420 RepID=UPI004063FC27